MMEGILVINPTEQSTRMQNVPVRSKGLGGASARKPLARIENTSQKSVTFNKTTLKPAKLGKNIQGSSIKSNTPGLRNGKSKSSNKKKVASTPAFKIFTDTTEKYDNEIEYMPPGDKTEMPSVPMPSYLHKACSWKPTFNIEVPRYGLSDEKLREYQEKMDHDVEKENERILNETNFEDDDLDAIIKSISTTNFVSDEDLLEQLEHDESLSLEVLDREIQTGGLIPQDW